MAGLCRTVPMPAAQAALPDLLSAYHQAFKQALCGQRPTQRVFVCLVTPPLLRLVSQYGL